MSQERIDALGDIADLIDWYLKNTEYITDDSDAWNIAGFELDKIETDWGWYFTNLPKPTIEQLETIKQNLE